MLLKRDNYALQAADARRLFLLRDQEAILRNIPLTADRDFFTLPFFGVPHRIHRKTGHILRLSGETWIPADSHGETLTLFDYLCDAAPDRALSGEFASVTGLGRGVHSALAENGPASALENAIDRRPGDFCAVCRSLGGVPHPGGDLSFRMRLFPDLPVVLRFWHGDEDFSPKLDVFWDKHTLKFLRYETVWYAAGVIRERLREAMGC